MKNYWKVLLLVAPFAIITGACNSNKATQSEVADTDSLSIGYDSTKLFIDVAQVDTMTLISKTGDTNQLIKEADFTTLSASLLTARYDTAWNESGIMVKMVEPDYTVIVHYKGKSADNNDWLMIWKDNGRTKFKNKWFFIEGENKDKITNLLDNYTKQ